MTLAVAAKEYVWLWDVRHGLSTNTIAIRERISLRRVELGVARADAHDKTGTSQTAFRPPPLIPFFPIGPFNPTSRCGHNRPIQVGSHFCCMVCHRSGLDDHPALKRDARTDPRPEPKPAPPPKPVEKPTRKQRREQIYGAHP